MDWGVGSFSFLIQDDGSLKPLGQAVKRDAQMANGMPVQSEDYPPGFTPADQQQLAQLCGKLAREWSKVAINATNVQRQGKVFVEVTP